MGINGTPPSNQKTNENQGLSRSGSFEGPKEYFPKKEQVEDGKNRSSLRSSSTRSGLEIWTTSKVESPVNAHPNDASPREGHTETVSQSRKGSDNSSILYVRDNPADAASSTKSKNKAAASETGKKNPESTLTAEHLFNTYVSDKIKSGLKHETKSRILDGINILVPMINSSKKELSDNQLKSLTSWALTGAHFNIKNLPRVLNVVFNLTQEGKKVDFSVLLKN